MKTTTGRYVHMLALLHTGKPELAYRGLQALIEDFIKIEKQVDKDFDKNWDEDTAYLDERFG